MLTEPVSVPADVLESLLAKHGIGELPLVLAAEARWRSPASRDALAERADRECTRLRWLDRRGRLDAEVTATLQVLLAPQVAYYGWITTGDRTIGVLAGATRGDGVTAVRDGDTVRLRPAVMGKLAKALVSHLPPVRPGAGKDVRVPVSELAAHADADDRVLEYESSAALRAVHRLAGLPSTGAGELTAAARDEVGRRCALAEPLRYLDTNAGRYLQLIDRPRRGEPHLLVGPSDESRLVTELHGLRAALEF